MSNPKTKKLVDAIINDNRAEAVSSLKQIIGQKVNGIIDNKRIGAARSFTAESIYEAVSDNDSASDVDQLKLAKYVAKKAGFSAKDIKKVYFDDADLVSGSKTVLVGAIDPKKKFRVSDLIKSLKDE